jgi:hypothetical protein
MTRFINKGMKILKIVNLHLIKQVLWNVT